MKLVDLVEHISGLWILLACKLVSCARRYDWEQEKLEEEERLREKLRLEQEARETGRSSVDHDAILRALSRALEATENAYLEMADKYVILLQLVPLFLRRSWGRCTVDY